MTHIKSSASPRGAAWAAPHLPWKQYLAPALLVLALLLPWWQINMVAPQYPDGLHVTTSFFSVTGDVWEVDDLNHYIGFMPLADVARYERTAAFVIGPLTLLLLIFAVTSRRRFAWLAALPAIMLPVIFVADLAGWLYYAGHHLDPHAALSASVAPWTPSLFGGGGVGQFHTFSAFGAGFYLAVACAVVAIVALRRMRIDAYSSSRR